MLISFMELRSWESEILSGHMRSSYSKLNNDAFKIISVNELVRVLSRSPVFSRFMMLLLCENLEVSVVFYYNKSLKC